MRPHIRDILAIGGLLALPCPILAQTPAPASTIIACEGPDMPAICPHASDAPRTQSTERADLAKREDFATLQARQMMLQRQALVRGVTPSLPRPPPVPVYQTFQPNPYMAPIAPPDFKGAAQVLGNVISGGPHD
jgi:hypothetical protein